MSNLRNKLKTDNTFNPFHDSFSPDNLEREILDLSTQANPSAEDALLAKTSISAIIFNKLYKDIYLYLKSTFEKVNLTYEEIVWGHLASLNRSCIISNNRNHEKYLQTTEVYFEDRFRNKITSLDKGIGRIDASGALETEIDGAHILLNYLRYFKEKIPAVDRNASKVASIGFIIRQSITGCFYYVLKSSYEDAIWKNGNIEIDKDTKRIDIKFNDPNLLKLFQIGYFRLERNSYSFFLMAISMREKGIINEIPANAEFKRDKTRISAVRVSNGFLKYKLSSGKDKQEDFIELAIESSLLAYYSYLENVPLPSLGGFSLRKLIAVHNVLIQLFVKAANIEVQNTSVKKKEDFYRYPFRISHERLRDYLRKRTKITEIEIDIFLDFIQSRDRVNLWSNPLIKINGDYYFALLPLSQPNILRLVDNWLEDGGVSLDERGKAFEKYIKQMLSESLKEKGFQFIIPNKSKFESKLDGKEEVDIMISLKNILIIGEVKCIKYPFETREVSNAYARLKKAVEQVKRKSKFIIDHIKEFEKEIGFSQSQKIVNIVITNYPLFTAQAIDSIPIVDCFLIESYFSSGTLSKGRITQDRGKFVSNEIISEKKFYSNEDEFSNNFLDTMTNPPAIQEIQPLIEIKENKISLDFLPYKIFVQTAEFKERPE